ncbi:hypothetical protein [Azospirillum doebereinerae]
MGQVIVLKHVRLTKTFQAVEAAALSLDSELDGLSAAAAIGLPDFSEETAMLRTYVRTLSVLLQAMTPDEIDEAGLSDRHALAEDAVNRCAANLKTLTRQHAPSPFANIA